MSTKPPMAHPSPNPSHSCQLGERGHLAWCASAAWSQSLSRGFRAQRDIRVQDVFGSVLILAKGMSDPV